MKKLTALILAIVICMGLGITAFASGEAASREPIMESEIETLIENAADDPDELLSVYRSIAIAWEQGAIIGDKEETLPPDYAKAAEYFCLAGELGDGYYYFDAGELFENGLVSGSPDYVAAEECYIRAAGSDHPNCKGVRNIGQWYEHGNEYVEKDLRMAAAYYRWAILLDDVSSLCYLGNLYQQGSLSFNGEPDYYSAAEYYQLAADRGNDSATGVAPALYQLGCFYENGLGVDMDLDTALALYRRAAAAGENKLGEFYPDAVAAVNRLG